MSQNCDNNCSSCSAECDSRSNPSLEDFREPPHEQSRIKKVIAVASGKGGVGKSMTSAMLAIILNRRGYKTAILDADITGPSIPRMFGIKDRAVGNEHGILPFETKTGIDIMSVNLLLENEADPVVWRGPVIAGTVKQFWQEVIWKDIDFMIIDLPPGTGDVPLTVFQTLPVDGLVIVSTPQELVGMIVAKAVNMASMMNVPVLGLVENMGFVKCPDCGKIIEPFGKSHAEEAADKFGIPLVGRIPMDPALASASDKGLIELFSGDWIDKAADNAEALLSK